MRHAFFLPVVMAVLSTVAFASFVRAEVPTLLPGDTTLGPARGDQSTPAVARGVDHTLVVWADERSNPTAFYEYETSSDIYGIRLDAAGQPVEAIPFVITAARASQSSPRVVWNGDHWLVVFQTYGLGGTGFYYATHLAAVRVSATGEVLDPEPIDIPGLGSSGLSWVLASDGTNGVVVNQGSPTSGDMVAVRISGAGEVLDPPTRVLYPETYYTRSNMKLAYASGVFLLTFSDYLEGTVGVRFDSELNLLGTSTTSLPDASLNGLAAYGSEFYIVWEQQLPDFSRVVTGSRVDTDGQMLDGAGDILSGAFPNQAFSTIGVVWDGINWRVSWGNNNALRLSRISDAGAVLDPDGVAVSGPETGVAAGTGDGGVQFVWPIFQNNEEEILAAHVSASNVAGPNRILSQSAPQQRRPDIACGDEGSLLVYRSSSAGGHRVLAQRLDVDGMPIPGEPIELDAGGNTSGPGNPSVAWNGSLYMVAWGNSNGVVAQRLTADGALVDAAPFVVMGDAFGTADIAALGSDFLVTGRRVSGSVQFIIPVAARVRGTDGVVTDTTPLVLGGYYLRVPPKVVALGDQWLVVFHRNVTHDNPLAETIGVLVPAAGTALTSFPVHGYFSTSGGNGIFEIGLASSGSTAMVVQSQELTSGVETDLLARFVGTNGTVSAMTNLTPWIGNQYRPNACWNGRHFIVTYQDQKNRLAQHTLDQLDARSDLFGMRVGENGAVLDPQGFLLSDSELAETDPTVAGEDGVIHVAAAFMQNDGVLNHYRIGLLHRDEVTNQAPVAVLSADVLVGDIPLTVTFDALGSFDPDGVLVSHVWDFGDDEGSNTASPSHTFNVPGSYRVHLTVTDAAGVSSTQSVMIQATPPNQLPIAVAQADQTSGNAPLRVVLSADGSYDPDGLVGNIEWRFSEGGVYWGSPAYHTYTSPGLYTVTLNVHDSRGGIGSTNLTINVPGFNTAPVAMAGATPTNGSAPLMVQFDPSGSYDPDGSIVGYRWSFGNGAVSTESAPSYTYLFQGNYTATLTVTDNNNVSSSDTVLIEVGPDPGTVLRSTDIQLSGSWRGKRLNVSGTVEVRDGNQVLIPGASVAVRWALPDGSTVTDSAASDNGGSVRFDVTGGIGTYRLTVISVSKAGYTFDAAGSVLTKTLETLPRLKGRVAGQGILLSWPSSSDGFVLQSATVLGGGGAWSTVGQVPVNDGTNYTLTVPIDSPACLYRLVQP